MSYIEELRKRVESAERRFGLIDEQQRRYSERLITLMNALETARGEQQTQIDSAQGRIAELERENGELRGMLHALLLGVEAGSRDTLADTLRDLDGRLSTMLGAAPRAAEPAAEALLDEALLDEAPLDEGATDEAPAAEAEGLDSIDLAGAAEAAVEVVAAADQEVVAEAPGQSEVAAEPTAEAVEEAQPDEAAAEEEEIVAVDAAEAEDPVAAAEQAVADLIGTGAEGGVPDAVDADAEEAAAAEAVAADDATVFDEAPADSAAEDAGAASPVGEMIERLAEETQDFPEPDVTDEAAPAAPVPARKKA